MSKTPPRASAGNDARSAWITIGEFRVRPFLDEDNLFAAATVQRLTNEGLAGRSMIDKVARTNWLTYGTMAAKAVVRDAGRILGCAGERERGEKGG